MIYKLSFISLLLLIGLTGCAHVSPSSEVSSGESSSTTEAQQFQKAPSFEFPNLAGEVVRLEDFKGKPVIINVWATWCPFCRQELVDFAVAQRQFGNQVMIIPINRAESKEQIQEFAKELNVTDELLFLVDRRDVYYRFMGAFSMPETLFVNGNGEVVFHKRGPMSLEEIMRRTKELVEMSQ